MSVRLPIRGYKWLSETEISTFDIYSVPHDARNGYILTVDLSYSSKDFPHHDVSLIALKSDRHMRTITKLNLNNYFFSFLKDFPLLVERLVVKEEDLSPFTRELLRKSNTKLGKEPKLIAGLRDRNSYTIHYVHLQYVLGHGVKLKKIHRILQFEQGYIFKSYVDKIVALRREAKTSSAKTSFKIVINSLYGRLLLDSEAFVKCTPVRANGRCKQLVNSKRYKKHTVISKDFVLVYTKPERVQYSSPLLIGGSVLCLSKLHQSSYWYDHVLKAFPSSRFLFSDTDSCAYHYSENEDYVQGRKKMSEIFDFSAFPKDHPDYSDARRCAPGWYKSELDFDSTKLDSQKRVSKFYALCPKMYCLKTIGCEETIKAKGIPRSLRPMIHAQAYHDAVFSDIVQRGDYYKITSANHTLFSKQYTKRLLSIVDSKRFWLSCGICSIALFRHDAQEIYDNHVCPYLPSSVNE